MDIIFTTNSPGEVMGWVKPLAHYTRESFHQARLTVFITPCAFASGTEQALVGDLFGVDQACSPQEYLSYILLRKSPQGFSPGEKGFVLFLGGDLTHAVLLGRRLKYPVFAYTEGRVGWRKSIRCFFSPWGEEKGPVKVVGNPLLDSAELGLTEELPLSLKEKTLALFPGSRPREISFMVPFFHQVLKGLEGVSVVLCRSPFIPQEFLDSILDGLEGAVEWTILSQGRYTLMKEASLALTLPGTTTLELAYLHCPGLVLLPLNRPQDIPLTGIPGLLGSIPLLGKMLKRCLVPILARKMTFMALPNLMAGKEILPEMTGVLKPEAVRSRVERLLSGEEEISWGELGEIIGESGASRRLLQEIANQLHHFQEGN